METKCNLFNKIVIVLILKILHNDFEVTTTSILEKGNKTVKKIQNIM